MSGEAGEDCGWVDFGPGMARPTGRTLKSNGDLFKAGVSQAKGMAHKRTNRRYRIVVQSRAAGTKGRPGYCERHFWILAFGVILVSIGTRTFDFSLTPPSYNGLFITRPYCGLHSWAGVDGLRPVFAKYLASVGG